MAAHKHIDTICIVIIMFTLLLTILFMNGKALGIQTSASEENSDAMFTTNDLDADWDTAGATKIVLSDEGSTVSGNGAYVYNGDIHIVYAGKYIISGGLSDGSVIVEADGDDKIWLMLSGVSIHCEDDAAIRVEQAGKVFLTLQDGTGNTLSSGASYDEEAVSAGVDGTIYSRDDLTINGAGSLQVTAEYQHGIVCNDDFVITGGTLNVTAIQDAIHANDSARIKDANLTLSAGDDGITVSNDEETSFLYVESGNISIPSCCEGLEAVQITVAGGTLDIAAADDGLNANGYSGNSVINITGGEITVTVENGRDADGIDSNKDIYISGGKLFVSVSDSGGSCAIDCGSEYGGKCEISGGTVLACGSSGMAEGFDSSSTQGFLMQTASASAGTTVTVKDADGNELISEEVPCSFSSVLVSTPNMKIGDTCTLIVGDTETEMTIDNASNGGSFGGFGGGGMHGRNGFGGKQMPDQNGSGDRQMPNQDDLDDRQMPNQDDFDGNVGMFDGEAPDETQDSASTQNGSELSSITAARPAVSLLSAAGNESQGGNMTGEAAPSDPQGGWNFGERQGGGNMRNPNGTMPAQENASQATAAGTSISAETLILLGISALVLLAGCVVAACYKRRG